jgi:FtsZ-binding cell division protein ZapB
MADTNHEPLLPPPQSIKPITIYQMYRTLQAESRQLKCENAHLTAENARLTAENNILQSLIESWTKRFEKNMKH